MTRKTYIEVTCDGCGCAEHFLYPTTNEQIQADGYIVDGRKHFCTSNCKLAYEYVNYGKGAIKIDEAMNGSNN